jgi:hypothetical protein
MDLNAPTANGFEARRGHSHVQSQRQNLRCELVCTTSLVVGTAFARSSQSPVPFPSILAGHFGHTGSDEVQPAFDSLAEFARPARWEARRITVEHRAPIRTIRPKTFYNWSTAWRPCHVARSRKDIAITQYRMRLRQEILDLSRALASALEALLGLAFEHAAPLTPACTHSRHRPSHSDTSGGRDRAHQPRSAASRSGVGHREPMPS